LGHNGVRIWRISSTTGGVASDDLRARNPKVGDTSSFH
jgi:hypothetical protein